MQHLGRRGARREVVGGRVEVPLRVALGVRRQAERGGVGVGLLELAQRLARVLGHQLQQVGGPQARRDDDLGLDPGGGVHQQVPGQGRVHVLVQPERAGGQGVGVRALLGRGDERVRGLDHPGLDQPGRQDGGIVAGLDHEVDLARARAGVVGVGGRVEVDEDAAARPEHAEDDDQRDQRGDPPAAAALGRVDVLVLAEALEEPAVPLAVGPVRGVLVRVGSGFRRGLRCPRRRAVQRLVVGLERPVGETSSGAAGKSAAGKPAGTAGRPTGRPLRHSAVLSSSGRLSPGSAGGCHRNGSLRPPGPRRRAAPAASRGCHRGRGRPGGRCCRGGRCWPGG